MNLDGPVRVASTAGSGTSTVTLSFDNWKGAKVAPTTHSISVLAAAKTAKVEPITNTLAATLVHPDRQTIVCTVAYSADGSKLFAAGYPSGMVQVFDASSSQEVELRRINTPPGLRGSADYALLAPDWKTLYVPVEVRKVKTVEKDGKRVSRVEQSGQIRVWDVATGEEQPSLQPPEGYSPCYARLSPDGRMLVCVERPGFSSDEAVRPKDVTVVWDLKTRTRRVLAPGFQVPAFAPDGKTLVVQWTDYQAKTSAVRVLDVATFKELARLDAPEKDRSFSLGGISPDSGISPDGSLVAVSLGSKKGAPREVWFRDARTLADRGRFIGEGNEDGYGWGGGRFTPDSKRYVILGVKGKAVVWDVGEKKVELTFDLESNSWQLAVSPDGKTLAVPWTPKSEADGLLRDRNPDPQDFPQPRVTLFDLTGKAPPRTLVLRHGFTGGVAFRPDGKVLALGTTGGVHLLDLTK